MALIKGLTVAELIEKLKQYRQDSVVVVGDGQGWVIGLSEVVQNYTHFSGKGWHGGPTYLADKSTDYLSDKEMRTVRRTVELR